jgi:hypothetical protein
MIFKNLKIGSAVFPRRFTNHTARYNGSTVSVTGNGIDTREYGQILFIVDYVVSSEFGSIDIRIFDSNTDDPATSAQITLNDKSGNLTPAIFGSIYSFSSGQKHGLIQCKATKRYLWAKTSTQSLGVGNCVNISYILNNANTLPVPLQVADFEIGF